VTARCLLPLPGFREGRVPTVKLIAGSGAGQSQAREKKASSCLFCIDADALRPILMSYESYRVSD